MQGVSLCHEMGSSAALLSSVVLPQLLNLPALLFGLLLLLLDLLLRVLVRVVRVDEQGSHHEPGLL